MTGEYERQREAARARLERAYHDAMARIDWLQRAYAMPWWKRLPFMWADKWRYRLIERPARWLGWR